MMYHERQIPNTNLRKRKCFLLFLSPIAPGLFMLEIICFVLGVCVQVSILR
ncbi:hypothetical protein NRI_0137 [Neorickettsia risticii str. Illinois]|uniref:Uncharacterized protein n=1 Tax=Neorickettsia risticii (strain Illinois) TaxID=434131 RepID=C6V418_NEORI|nr:hypothetical protein NRI_0137 [Neorickettsia risticii str. Illinois]